LNGDDQGALVVLALLEQIYNLLWTLIDSWMALLRASDCYGCMHVLVPRLRRRAKVTV